jgi:hypothetical protein
VTSWGTCVKRRRVKHIDTFEDVVFSLRAMMTRFNRALPVKRLDMYRATGCMTLSIRTRAHGPTTVAPFRYNL